MTTYETRSSRTGRSLLPVAVATGVVALALMLIGTYLDTPYKAQGSGEWGALGTHSLAELPLVIAFALVGPAVVFGIVVMRALRTAPQTAALRSLILAAAGVVSLVVFWTGLPVVLSAGAAALALADRLRVVQIHGRLVLGVNVHSATFHD